jgi:hypothetical protein
MKFTWDLLFGLGVLGVGTGLWMIHPPTCLVCLGVFAIGLSVWGAANAS